MRRDPNSTPMATSSGSNSTGGVDRVVQRMQNHFLNLNAAKEMKEYPTTSPAAPGAGASSLLGGVSSSSTTAIPIGSGGGGGRANNNNNSRPAAAAAASSSPPPVVGGGHQHPPSSSSSTSQNTNAPNSYQSAHENLQRAIRLSESTNQHGQSALTSLGKQGETITRSINAVEETQANLRESNRTLREMKMQVWKEFAIKALVIASLLVLIVIIIDVKWVRKRR